MGATGMAGESAKDDDRTKILHTHWKNYQLLLRQGRGRVTCNPRHASQDAATRPCEVLGDILRSLYSRALGVPLCLGTLDTGQDKG